MTEELMTRLNFKSRVFTRDGNSCVICTKPAVDAHHILDRKLYTDGGYYLSNGASLCAACHLDAEMTVLSVTDIRSACDISGPKMPDGFDPCQTYDKWGNQILPDGTRSPGPMFDDDGARKILQRAGILYDGTFRL